MKKTSLFFALFALIACQETKKEKEKISPTAILISKANIIDVQTGEIKANQNIVIDAGKIQRITDTSTDPLQYTTVINGEGKYLIPGLAEMHAHIPQPPTTTERTQETLFLYLANGITTIRGMLGHPSHIALRENAKNGDLVSPRIFTASPSLNGNSIKTKEEAITKVKGYQEEGYDFLKIHPGIQRAVFDQAVQTANEVGIPFAGHVPVDVGVRHALKSKYASIDHIDGFLEGLVPESENVDPTQNGFFGYGFTPLADTQNIDELVQLTKDNKVWIVPTQSLFKRWFAPIGADELLAEDEMKYMPKATLENWKKVKEDYMKNENFSEDQWKQFDAIRKQLLKKLSDNGHGILLGSDAPQLFNVPGFSIIHEAEAMADAGMTPLEILQAGTLNPAAYFGMEDTFGAIKEGMDADIVLLDKNPLIAIKNLRHVSGVMYRGKWLSKTIIEKRLAEIAKNAAK